MPYFKQDLEYSSGVYHRLILLGKNTQKYLDLLKPLWLYISLLCHIKLELRLVCMERLIDLKRSGACCRLGDQNS